MTLEIKWQVRNISEKIRMGRCEFAFVFLYYLHSLSSPRHSACCTMDNRAPSSAAQQQGLYAKHHLHQAPKLKTRIAMHPLSQLLSWRGA